MIRPDITEHPWDTAAEEEFRRRASAPEWCTDGMPHRWCHDRESPHFKRCMNCGTSQYLWRLLHHFIY